MPGRSSSSAGSTATRSGDPGDRRGPVPVHLPDGLEVGFFAEGKLKKVPLAGARQSFFATRQPAGGELGTDGTIVFVPSPSGGLQRIPASEESRKRSCLQIQ